MNAVEKYIIGINFISDIKNIITSARDLAIRSVDFERVKNLIST
jgi:hypothetical protein